MKSRTKWIIGLGCLPILGCGGCVAGVLGIVFGALSSSEPYKMTVSELNQNVQATELLGTPIEGGWLVTGEVNISGDSGYADLSIPVSGPRGAGTADVKAAKVKGTWSIGYLALHTDGGKQVLVGAEDMVLPWEQSSQDLPAEAPESAPSNPNDKVPINRSAKGDSPIEPIP